SCSSVARTGLMFPFAASHWREVRQIWHDHWRKVVGVAILSPLAYVMVLHVLTFTPVTYVAPLREVSILIGVLMGSRWLSEGDSQRRLVAAGTIVAGVVAIALG
ncbi:MAG TPA: EamA family transporter, partial [Phototrophicaceae bacterium]|nr:EamA family transporter [Phototrophicaceae bacterium]